MKCPNCDFETQGQFCGECGTRLPKDSSAMKWLTIAGMAFLALVGFGVLDAIFKDIVHGPLWLGYVIWGLLVLGIVFLTRWIIKKGIHAKKPFKIGCFVLVGLVSIAVMLFFIGIVTYAVMRS